MTAATALVLLLSAQAAVGLVKTPYEESPLRVVDNKMFDLKEALKEYDNVIEDQIAELHHLQEVIQARLAARSASSEENETADEEDCTLQEQVVKFLLSALVDLKYAPMNMSALDVVEGQLKQYVFMLGKILEEKGVSQAVAPLHWKTETGDLEPALGYLFQNIYMCIGMMKKMIYSKFTLSGGSKEGDVSCNTSEKIIAVNCVETTGEFNNESDMYEPKMVTYPNGYTWYKYLKKCSGVGADMTCTYDMDYMMLPPESGADTCTTAKVSYYYLTCGIYISYISSLTDETKKAELTMEYKQKGCDPCNKIGS
jgi:hypothetical protein